MRIAAHAAKSWVRSRVENRSYIASDVAILLTIILHFGEGITFAVTNAASGSIGMAALLSAAFGSPMIASVVLIVTALMACFGQWRDGLSPVMRLSLLLPQQTILLIPAFGALVAIMMSHYADGVPRAWIFILWDQTDRLGMPIIYATALYARLR